MKMALTRIGKEKIRQLTPITEGGEAMMWKSWREARDISMSLATIF